MKDRIEARKEKKNRGGGGVATLSLGIRGKSS